MDRQKTPAYGAVIERGTISGTGTDGYIVSSLDRDGIVTPEIAPVTENETYAAGDCVYFFLFPDGSGKIIGKA